MAKWRTGFLVSYLIIALTACGTILYPERKGQIQGRIDPMVLALDGLGLIFYLIPGVIAFAVDFSNGTIYLPHSKSSRLSDNSVDVIHLNHAIAPADLPMVMQQVLPDDINWQQAQVVSEPVALAWLQ